MVERKITFESAESGQTIRFATKKDISNIMKFIKEYWSETHILANNRVMFEFQYVYGEEVCFVISLDKVTDEIEGVLGYIPYDTEKERDIFTALWKVRQGKNLFQGIELLYFLEEKGNCRNLYCAGINPKTFSIYKYMRKIVTKMEHYYILNDLEEYQVAVVKNKKSVKLITEKYEARLIKNIDELEIFGEYEDLQSLPYKSKEYVDRRFFHHPVYQYDIYKITTVVGPVYIVGRIQACNHQSVFRIVDMFGKDGFQYIGNFLKDLMVERKFEYIDCYAYGISEEIMNKSGFSKIEEGDENIIPNYFEPYVQENVPIHIFVPKNVSARMFKGDGDQDRPNFFQVLFVPPLAAEWE